MAARHHWYGPVVAPNRSHDGPDPGTWQRVLDARRADALFERDSELQALHDFLGSSGRLAIVVGPGGTGKSVLLRVAADHARRRGMSVRELHVDEIDGSATDRVERAPPTDVYFIDGVDWNEPRHADRILAWARRHSPGQKLIAACRREPAEGVIVGIGADRRAVVALGPLSQTGAEASLKQWGIAEGRRSALASAAKGNPRILAGLATATSIADAADDLARELVEHAPSAAHRLSLRIATLLSHTTASDLESVLGSSSGERTIEWLTEQPGFVHHGAGLRPVGLLRDALFDQWRRSSPTEHDDAVRRVEKTPPELIIATGSLSQVEELRAMATIRRQEGPASASRFQAALEQSGGKSWIVRDATHEPVGFLLALELEKAERLTGAAPPRPQRPLDPPVLAVRWWGAYTSWKRPSAVARALMQALARDWNGAAAIHRGTLHAVAEGDGSAERDDDPSLWRVDHSKRLARTSWLTLRDASDDDSTATPPMLSRIEFDVQFRRALKHFHRADRLLTNDLLAATRSRDADELRDWLTDACTPADPGPTRPEPILQHTFFERRTKQLAVAIEMGISYSTYRRRLEAALCWASDRAFDRLRSSRRDRREETTPASPTPGAP